MTSKENSVIEESNFELTKNSEVELTENGEVELTENEQIGRINLLLSGIASILLTNITAVVIAFSFGFFGDFTLRHRNSSNENEKGKIFTQNQNILINLIVESKKIENSN